MLKRLTGGVCLLCGLAAGIAGASEAVRKNFQAKFPQVTVESVTRTPVAGIYEVYAGGQIIYTDENVKYLFLDTTLVDVDAKVNLTRERMQRLSAIKFDALPLDLAFRKVVGNGKRKLGYFADPNCPYCKRFEQQELSKVTDVTVYIFLYPILSPDSVAKAKAVWCSKDRVKTWDDWMLRGVAPTGSGNCSTPVEKILAYGRKMNITGTPTLIFADGQRVPGMIPAAQLEQLLANAGGK
ncbi:MAG: DsbC family protein [Betaproteobacteria bacterium]|nr:DsbC family protein [Betaproteobacteria bacterium]